MTDREKTEEMFEKYSKDGMFEFSTYLKDAQPMLAEAIAYGRSSALAEVEAELPMVRENTFSDCHIDGQNYYWSRVRNLISSKRGELEK